MPNSKQCVMSCNLLGSLLGRDARAFLCSATARNVQERDGMKTAVCVVSRRILLPGGATPNCRIRRVLELPTTVSGAALPETGRPIGRNGTSMYRQTQ